MQSPPPVYTENFRFMPPPFSAAEAVRAGDSRANAPPKPTVSTSFGPPSPPPSPSPDSPTSGSNNLLRRFSAQLARRVSSGTPPNPNSNANAVASSSTAESRHKRVSGSPVGAVRAGGRRRIGSVSDAVQFAQVGRATTSAGVGERATAIRALRALGRSQSDAARACEIDRLDELTLESESSTLRRGRRARVPQQGADGLYWDDDLGICWDGNEIVQPDMNSYPVYTSNSDTLPPRASALHTLTRTQSRQGAVSPAPPPPALSHRVVYASTLSSFPPRAPLKPALPSPPASPIARDPTPAELIREEWRRTQLFREEETLSDDDEDVFSMGREDLDSDDDGDEEWFDVPE